MALKFLNHRFALLGVLRWLALSLAVASAVGHAAAAQADGGGRVIVGYRVAPRLSTAEVESAASRAIDAAQAVALGQRLGVDLTPGRWVGPRAQVLSARGLDAAPIAGAFRAYHEVRFGGLPFDETRRAMLVDARSTNT